MKPSRYSAADQRRIIAQAVLQLGAVTDEGWDSIVQAIRLPDGTIVRPKKAMLHDLKLVAELVGGELIQLPVRVYPNGGDLGEIKSVETD